MYQTMKERDDKKRARKLLRRSKKRQRQSVQKQSQLSVPVIVKPKTPRLEFQRQVQRDHSYSIVCDGQFSERQGSIGVGQLSFEKDVLTGYSYWMEEIESGTSQRAKLVALWKSVTAAQMLIGASRNVNVQIICDSDYALRALLDGEDHSSNGWMKNKNQSLKNLDIMRPMFESYRELQDQITLTMRTWEQNCTSVHAAKTLANVALGSMKTTKEYSEDLLRLSSLAECIPKNLFGQ